MLEPATHAYTHASIYMVRGRWREGLRESLRVWLGYDVVVSNGHRREG